MVGARSPVDQQPSRRWVGKAENGWQGFSGEAAIQDSPELPMRVNIRRKPWSVPRFRGRGEQGYGQSRVTVTPRSWAWTGTGPNIER